MQLFNYPLPGDPADFFVRDGWLNGYADVVTAALELLERDAAFQRLLAVLTVEHPEVYPIASRVVCATSEVDCMSAVLVTTYNEPVVAHGRWRLTYWFPLGLWGVYWEALAAGPEEPEIVPRAVKVHKDLAGAMAGEVAVWDDERQCYTSSTGERPSPADLLLVWDTARQGYVAPEQFDNPEAPYVPLALLPFLGADIQTHS